MTPTPSIFSRPCFRRALALATPIVVALVAAAGCGGNSPSSSSAAASAAGAKGSAGEAAFQFSACMRHHGVTNFPDPVVKSSANGSSVSIGINPTISGQPAFKSAQTACQHILPKGGNGPDSSPAARQAKTQALIAFARCLRAHGFPNFPDPDATGELSQEMINRAGINLHTPALLEAGKNCTSVTHGQITPAQVVQAISHAGTPDSHQTSSP